MTPADRSWDEAKAAHARVLAQPLPSPSDEVDPRVLAAEAEHADQPTLAGLLGARDALHRGNPPADEAWAAAEAALDGWQALLGRLQRP